MAKKTEDLYVITAKQARSLMNPFKVKGKLTVHYMNDPGASLIGGNVELVKVIKEMKKAELMKPGQVRFAGPNMQELNHGICYWKNDKTGYVFIETDAAKLKALHKEIGTTFPKKVKASLKKTKSAPKKAIAPTKAIKVKPGQKNPIRVEAGKKAAVNRAKA